MPPLDPFWANSLPARRYIYTSPLDYTLGLSSYECDVDADRLTIPTGQLNAGDKAFVIATARLWVWTGSTWQIVNSANRQEQNQEAFPILGGQAIAPHPSGGVMRADSSASSTVALGIATADIASGAMGPVQVRGLVTLVDWTAGTGSPSLTLASIYFLNTAGQLSLTPPSSGYSQIFGRSVDAKTMLLTAEARVVRL